MKDGNFEMNKYVDSVNIVLLTVIQDKKMYHVPTVIQSKKKYHALPVIQDKKMYKMMNLLEK